MRILMIIVPAQRGQEPLTVEQIIEPYYHFRDNLVEVVLASPDGGSPVAAVTVPISSSPARRLASDNETLEVLADTLCLDEVFVEDFEAAYYVGAPENLDSDRQHPVFRFLTELLAAGKPLALVSSEPTVTRCIAGRAPGLAAVALLRFIAGNQ